MMFVFGLHESLLFIWSFQNGWKSGDWHFLVFDIFHEQPQDLSFGVVGVRIGVFGFFTQIGFKYEKIKEN